MALGSNPIQEMLSAALEMEEKGRAFYEKASATCRNDLGRAIFQQLAGDEILHVARIRSIYESLTGKAGWSEEWKSLGADPKDLRVLFKELALKQGAKITPETSDLEAVEVGIDFEAKSVRYYEEHRAGAVDPREQAFLDKMIVEERSHHATLLDMKLYLTDPSSWFLEMEHGGLDGA